MFAVYDVPDGTSTLLAIEGQRLLETVLCYFISSVVCTLLTEGKRSESRPPSHREDIITKLRLRLHIASQNVYRLQLLHLLLLPVELALRVSQILLAGLRAAPNSVLSANGLESIVEDPLRCDLHRLVEHVR